MARLGRRQGGKNFPESTCRSVLRRFMANTQYLQSCEKETNCADNTQV